MPVRPRPAVEAELTECAAVHADTRRGLVIAAGVVTLVLVVGAAIFVMSPDDGSPEGAALTTPATKRTPETTAAATPTTVLDLPTLTIPPPPPPIPGLRASDVEAALTADGFRCNPSPDFQSEDHVIIDCGIPGGTASARTYATMADELVAMEGYAFAVSDHRWLTFLATQPWDGADPAAAQTWVEQTLQAGGVIGARNEQTIGGVPCALIAFGGDLWQIEVGEPPYTT